MHHKYSTLKLNVPARNQVPADSRPQAQTNFLGQGGDAWTRRLRGRGSEGEGRSRSSCPARERGARRAAARPSSRWGLRSALGPPRHALRFLPNLLPCFRPAPASYLSEDEAGRSGAAIGSFQPAPSGCGASSHLDSTHRAREKRVSTAARGPATTRG